MTSRSLLGSRQPACVFRATDIVRRRTELSCGTYVWERRNRGAAGMKLFVRVHIPATDTTTVGL